MYFEVIICDLKIFGIKFDSISYGKKWRKRRDQKKVPLQIDVAGLLVI